MLVDVTLLSFSFFGCLGRKHCICNVLLTVINQNKQIISVKDLCSCLRTEEYIHTVIKDTPPAYEDKRKLRKLNFTDNNNNRWTWISLFSVLFSYIRNCSYITVSFKHDV